MVLMMSAGKGRGRGAAVVLLAAFLFLGVASPSLAGATTQVPPVTRGGGAATATTVSPLQPGATPVLAPESDSVGVGAPGPLRISAGGDDRQPRPPLWVGAVVGASGVAGLALSAALHRRRGGAVGRDRSDLAKAV